jgi:hypothetical protein
MPKFFELPYEVQKRIYEKMKDHFSWLRTQLPYWGPFYLPPPEAFWEFFLDWLISVDCDRTLKEWAEVVGNKDFFKKLLPPDKDLTLVRKEKEKRKEIRPSRKELRKELRLRVIDQCSTCFRPILTFGKGHRLNTDEIKIVKLGPNCWALPGKRENYKDWRKGSKKVERVSWENSSWNWIICPYCGKTQVLFKEYKKVPVGYKVEEC